MSTSRPVLTPLDQIWSRPRPVRVLAIPLACAAALFVASMRLPLHHHQIAGDGYSVVYGIQGASWLLAIAGLAVAFAVRFLVEPPGGYSKFCVAALAFAVLLGMFGDYIDTIAKAAQLFVSPYFGPGFFVGLAGAALVLASAVLVFVLRGD